MTHDLIQHVGTKKKVQITRRKPSEPFLNGFLLDSSPSLVLMHAFHDFMPDGYVIFRLDDVEEFRSGPYERHWENMLQAEGLLDGLNLTAQIDLSSMRSAIESIRACFEYLIIECEDEEEDIEDFYIGSVVSTTSDHVTFRYIDACGHWDAEQYEIDFEDITKVQFDTQYLRIFPKYLQSGPRPKTLEDED